MQIKYTIRHDIVMNSPTSMNADEKISEIHLLITHFLLASAHSELHWEFSMGGFWQLLPGNM